MTHTSEQAELTNFDRDALIIKHLPLVRAIAVRVAERLPCHIQLDDLIHAGVMGLIDSAKKFETRRATEFASYAKFRIRGAILDSLREIDVVSREVRQKRRKIEAATAALTVELQRAPTEEEVAERTGMNPQLQRKVISLCHQNTVVSTSVYASTEQAEMDLPGNPEGQPDRLYEQQERRNVVLEAMKGLAPRYRKVVVLYYTNQLTMKEIANQMGINESRVSQIHKSALEKLSVALQAAGIQAANIL